MSYETFDFKIDFGNESKFNRKLLVEKTAKVNSVIINAISDVHLRDYQSLGRYSRQQLLYSMMMHNEAIEMSFEMTPDRVIQKALDSFSKEIGKKAPKKPRF